MPPSPIPPAPPRLAMRGVSKRYGATVALDGVDLTVGRGEIVALVGENGAGKSTLMKILSGAVAPDAGEIAIDGVPYRPAGPQPARQAGVAMIYQELALAPHLTVEENILLGAEPHRGGWIRRTELRRRAAEALALFGHDELRPNTRVARLSVGARQLVEIARALAVGCRVLVLDEPTSSLAGRDVERLFGLLDRLRAEGQAIVYISHFIEEVQRVADRVVVLRDGRVADVLDRAAARDAGRIVERMVGREVSELYPRSARTPGETILELEGVAGVRKPVAASLALRRGEVLGVAGLVGAGRTELLRAVMGLDPVRAGTVRVAGVAGGSATPHRRLRQGVGLLSEDRKGEGLALGLSVEENLVLSNMRPLGPAGFVWPRRRARVAQQWIDRLQIRCRAPGQSVRTLSGGNQQKVALARLLHHDVDVLLLDEPTRGVDVGSKAELYRLIDRLASGEPATARRPRAVLMVSSYLPELLGVCDRIAVLYRGRLGEARPVGDWTEHTLMLAATGPGEEKVAG